MQYNTIYKTFGGSACRSNVLVAAAFQGHGHDLGEAHRAGFGTVEEV